MQIDFIFIVFFEFFISKIRMGNGFIEFFMAVFYRNYFNIIEVDYEVYREVFLSFIGK